MSELYEKLYSENKELKDTIFRLNQARDKAKKMLGYDTSVSIDNVFKDHKDLQSQLTAEREGRRKDLEELDRKIWTEDFDTTDVLNYIKSKLQSLKADKE